MSTPLLFPLETLHHALETRLLEAGLDAGIAATEARIMAEADLHGVPSHGVRMLPPLLTALRDGGVNPRPVWTTVRETLATSLIDTDNGPGRSASIHAMEDAMRRARACGAGVCVARRTTHWGRAHAYANHAAQQGLVGICMTNAMPTMAAWSATRRLLGNNPVAIGIPGEDPQRPLVLDMAMSQAAVGKVNTWKRESREIPEGWGLDAEGRPSRDAAAILGGAVLPFGGHKGAGLALVFELLTVALAGGAFGNEIVAANRSGLDPDSCKLFIALDPEAFGGIDTLRSRTKDYLDYLASEAEGFTWPGERGWTAQAHNLEAGVPLHPDIVAELTAAGVRLPKAA